MKERHREIPSRHIGKSAKQKARVRTYRELASSPQNFVMIRRLAPLNRIAAIPLLRCVRDWLVFRLSLWPCVRASVSFSRHCSRLFTFLLKAPEECHKGVNVLSLQRPLRRQCATPDSTLL